MTSDPFAGLLDPLAWWDLSATYDKYAAFFDLTIYCAIFIALAHVVFTSRFSGRPGKVMATAVGLALGISLAVGEERFGWNLRQAGPIAILIALLLVGFLILHVLVRIHVKWTLAVPLSYVIVYLFVRAMSPALLAVITDKVPFVNLLSAIIFLICVWQVGVAIWPKRHSDVMSGGNDSSFVSGLERDNEKREIKVEKRIKRHLAPQAERETVRLERNLGALLNETKREKPDWQGIARALSDIAHKADEVNALTDRIRVLDRRLRNFDWHELQELSGYYQDLNDADKERLKEQILLERRKIVQEHAVVELAERCERRHEEFRSVLDSASRACLAGDSASATQSISHAIAIEHEQAQDMDRVRHAEKRLLSLTKLKLRREAG